MGSTTIPSSGGVVTKTLNTQIFRSSGTWTYPTSANFDGTVEVTVVGGGGSGGNGVWRNGNGTGSNNYCTGGGGGGEVISTTVSVLGLGNQTVVVGAGGQGATANLGGMCGGYSSFGAVTVANAYPDPEPRWGLLYSGAAQTDYPEAITGITLGNNMSVRTPVSSTGSVTPQLGSYLQEIQLSASGADAMYSDWFSVNASTSYVIGFSYARWASNLNAQTVTCRVYWYTSAGASISSSVIASSYTVPTSGTTWTLASATVTTPANAAFGRYSWTSTNAIGASHAVNGLFVTPASTGITTAVFGNTTNYKWLNSPYKSPTLAIDSKSVTAQGGGGGWGILNYQTSSWIAYYPLLGYSEGGDCLPQCTTASSTTFYHGGHGGGAGGNAIEPEVVYQVYTTALQGAWPTGTSRGTNSTTGILAQSSYTGPYQWITNYPNTGGGYGSMAYQWGIVTNNLTGLAHWGSNGKGVEIDGQSYGAGGVGGQYNSLSVRANYRLQGGISNVGTSSTYPDSSAYMNAYYDAAANTGNGGNGIGISGGTQSRGGHGGSGIVIVKWYT